MTLQTLFKHGPRGGRKSPKWLVRSFSISFSNITASAIAPRGEKEACLPEEKSGYASNYVPEVLLRLTSSSDYIC